MKAHFSSPYRMQQKEAKKMIVGLLLLSISMVGVSAITLVLYLSPRVELPHAIPIYPKEEALPSHQLFVPIRNIPPRSRLSPSQFRSITIASPGVSAQAISDINDLTDRYSNSMLYEGVPIAREAVITQMPKGGLSDQIPPDYRAVAIKVNKQTIVEGLVQPEDRVDVSWLTQLEGKPALIPIVQNALVLSVEQKTEKSERPGAPTTATLLVTSKDANKVTFALATGAVSLTLRGRGDDLKLGDSTPVTAGMLLPSPRSARVESSYSGRFSVQDGPQFNVTKDGRLEEVPAPQASLSK